MVAEHTGDWALEGAGGGGVARKKVRLELACEVLRLQELW